jgi:hypothetical protein
MQYACCLDCGVLVKIQVQRNNNLHKRSEDALSASVVRTSAVESRVPADRDPETVDRDPRNYD